MAWLRIDDGFTEHQKVAGLSDRAFRLHVAGLCYCARNLTDGRLSGRAYKVVSAIVGTKGTRYPQELVDSGVWLQHPADGYQISGYLDWNPSANKVKTERRKAADRQTKHRESNAVTNGVTNGARHALRATVPHPIPLEELTRAVPVVSYAGAEIVDIRDLVNQSLEEATA